MCESTRQVAALHKKVFIHFTSLPLCVQPTFDQICYVRRYVLKSLIKPVFFTEGEGLGLLSVTNLQT